MPLRRNRRQYEQLTDFDNNKPQRSRHPVPSRETIRRRLTEKRLTPHHRQCRLDFADLGHSVTSSSVMNQSQC
ncbi:hypothetical protein TNCV_4306401 [Trichonephila clavipes]|nr:hypothetical protein TNCV_4306401 [Trichonephila clavipes]